MRQWRQRAAMLLVCSLATAGEPAAARLAAAREPSAAQMARQARQAEKKGEHAKAYLLYAQAAAKDPSRREYVAKAESLQRQAMLQNKSLPGAPAAAPLPPPEDKSLPTLDILTNEEIESARELQEPAHLIDPPVLKSYDRRAPAREQYEQVAKDFGVQVIFDDDFKPPAPVLFRTENVGLRLALELLQTATNSFVVPLGDRILLVAQDNQQKRLELETAVTVTVPIPETTSPQEATELATTLRTIFEIRRLGIDTQRRNIVLKDRISVIEPARILLHQLLQQRAEVMVELEFVSINKSSSLAYGLSLPNRFPLVYLGGWLSSVPAFTTGFTRFLTFGGGNSLFGIGVTNAQLLASLTRNTSATLLRAQVRAGDNTEARLHIGDKYPIITGQFLGANPGGVTGGLGFPPTFNFEELGLTFKMKPHVHGTGEVTLEIETEFKVLGAGSFNGIPIISNRKFTSQVRLRDGEYAVVAGLLTETQARSISGLAGLTSVPILGPLLSNNLRDTEESNVLIVLKPRIIGTAPGYARPFAVGSEGRSRMPL